MKPRSAMWCALSCVALRIALALGTETYPDEAYYWTWSKHLQLSYFDHPGMIAWSIALLGLRTGALVWGVVTLLGVFKLARALGGDPTVAWWATALFASTPASNLLGTFATPDAPLLAFWVWTLVAAVQQRPWLTGALWGLAMLSKYNGLLLGAPILVAFWRAPLRLLGLTLVALVVTSPTLAWNATHDWEGFRFQFAHGLGGGGGLATFLEFVGGQFGMAGPLLLVSILVWLARRERALLWVATVIPVLFFGYASLRARGEANWTAAAWLSASVGVAMTASERWKAVALGLNVAAVAVGAVVLIAPPQRLWSTPFVQKLHGWEMLARAKEQAVPLIITNRYQLSALATWYSGIPATTLGGRRSQYDLWNTTIAEGADALWIGEWEGPPGELVERFETSTQLDWPLDDRQRALHPFLAFRLGHAKPHVR